MQDVLILVYRICHYLFPYFVCAKCKGSGEPAQMYRVARTFAAPLCGKVLFHTSWVLAALNIRVDLNGFVFLKLCFLLLHDLLFA